MADNNKENRMSIDDFDFAHEDANDDTSMLVNYLVTRLHQAMGNPALQGEVQQQLHAYGILPPIQQERGPERFQGETSKRGLSTEKGVENPYQELKQLLEGKPSSKKKGQAQPERSPSREREENELSDESMEDVAPRRRRAQRSPTPTKRKRSPHSPHRRESKREEKNSKKKKERKRSPSSPSSSPSSSSDEGSGYSSQERQRRGHRRSYAAWKRSSKLKKFKEGGKNISFLTYDGTFGATDKVLAFIQQFDAAFGDEGFTESSKLRHVAMHFQKSARQWWASLRANGEAPKTWKTLRTSIMKQFLASDAKDKPRVQNTSQGNSKMQSPKSQRLDIEKEEMSSKDINITTVESEHANSSGCKWLLESITYMSNLLMEELETGDISGQNIEIVETLIKALHFGLLMQPSGNGSSADSADPFSKIDRCIEDRFFLSGENNKEKWMDVLKYQHFILQSVLKDNSLRVPIKQNFMIQEAQIELRLLLKVVYLQGQHNATNTSQKTGVVKKQGDDTNLSHLRSSDLSSKEDQKALKSKKDHDGAFTGATSLPNVDVIEKLSATMKRCLVKDAEEEDTGKLCCPLEGTVDSQNAGVAVKRSGLFDKETTPVAHEVDNAPDKAGELSLSMDVKQLDVDDWEYLA
ncbi:hypothetical protein L7F22_048377 [Adiantum nelumboides]|nr:hypothetical protein [Adiantum nelumboides]